MTFFSAKMSVSPKVEADSPLIEVGTEDEVESRDELEDESSRSAETLPTFHGQNKLGFSIGIHWVYARKKNILIILSFFIVI